MFDESQKQAYNNIKAPEHLRERVLSSASNEKTEHRWFSPVAFRRLAVLQVCLVCLVAVGAVGIIAGRGGADVNFYFDGAEVTENHVANVGTPVVTQPFSSRSIPGVSIRVDIKTDKACHIYVNGGFISKAEESSENLSPTLDIAEDSALVWTLENPVQDSYTLTAQSGSKTFILVLEYLEQTDEWVLYEKQ